MISLVVPALSGPNTGGTRFNRRLVAALRDGGQPVQVRDFDTALDAIGHPMALPWIDSLWLPRLGEWLAAAQRVGVPARFGLLTHYLPALVEHGERPPAAGLSEGEALALRHAEAFLVPSEYLASELRALGVDPSRISVLEPGLDLPVEPTPGDPTSTTRAVMLANVVEGKGVAPLLDALAKRLHDDDALELRLIGSLEMEPGYAQRCAVNVREHPALSPRVHLTGPASHENCIHALLEADVLLSASRMESYGMALAEARGCGRPVIARKGGNASAHVRTEWGGRLVDDETAVADALVEFARDTEARRERSRLAWTHRLQRTWSACANDLLAALADRSAPRPPQ
ncbi:MAG: glycosyltransferase family 4 protein [Myxococcota bacterium]